MVCLGDPDIEPSACIRTPLAFLTAMDSVALTAKVGRYTVHQVPILNAGSDRNQVSCGRWLSILILAVLPATVGAEALRIAAWNLEHLKDTNLEGCVPRVEADYAAITRQVEALDADIVAFQEVENEAAARRVFPPSEWQIEVSTRPVPASNRTCRERPEALLGHLATGFAIRRGIPYRREADLSALGVGSRFDRWGTEVSLLEGGRELRLLSIHLKSGCWGAGEDRDVSRATTCRTLHEQLRVLKVWSDEQRGAGVDFVILGDFNRRLAIPGDAGWTTLSPAGAPLGLVTTGRISRCDFRFVEYIDHLVLGGRAVEALVPDSFREVPREGPHPDHCAIAADFDLDDSRFAGPRSLPLVMAAGNTAQEGFVRLINRSDRAGTLRIHAIDDSGREFPPISLELDADATLHFNSRDLEEGNEDKGLVGGVGDGEGDWRLELDSELEIDALAYVRTSDGFVTSMHEIAAQERDGAMRYHVPFFNPGSNSSQVSLLRLINPGEEIASIVIAALDDRGESPPGGEVRLTLPAGAARMFRAEQLEQGDEEFSGGLGDGEGKWRLFVSADRPLQVMSLLQSPTGSLTNLSR